ncbi:hypothetical protein EON81_29750, partial [bacterium]
MSLNQPIASTLGPRDLEISCFKISVFGEDAYVSSFKMPDISFEIHDAHFFQNRTLKSVAIHVFTAYEKVEARDLLESFIRAFGLTPAPAADPVAQLLSSLFPKESVTFFRKASKRPHRIGAVLSTQDAELLFLFHIRLGALRAPELPEELLRSMRIIQTDATTHPAD